MRYLAGFVFALALCVAGCGESESDGKCRSPLSEYCTGSSCPTYDEAVAGYVDATGTCIDLRYVLTGSLLRHTLFFYADGTLAAARKDDDVQVYCGETSHTILYGPVPDCPEVFP